MTQNEFVAECAELLIDPAIAIENEKVQEALARRDDEAVRELLETEF